MEDMGFITPGIRHVFGSKRVTHFDNKSMNNSVHSNENKHFNQRYPRVMTRAIKDIRGTFDSIKAKLANLKRTGKDPNIDHTRMIIERYIRLVNEVESSVGMKGVTSLPAQDAYRMLKIIINDQAKQLAKELSEAIPKGDYSLLEAQFNRDFELSKGGCILLNTFLMGRTTVDDDLDVIRKEEDLLLDDEQLQSDHEHGENLVLDVPLADVMEKPKSLHNLPDEVLLNIISHSNNLLNVLATCKFFHGFVLTHKEFISYQILKRKYLLRYPLRAIQKDQIEHAHSNLDDLDHHINSHKQKVEDMKPDDHNMEFILEVIKGDFDVDMAGKFHPKRYRDPDTMVVILNTIFESRLLTYQVYKLLKSDYALSREDIRDFELAHKEKYDQLGNSTTTQRIEKSAFESFWKEHPISTPFMDMSNPANIHHILIESYVDKLRILLDLMTLETKFTDKLEDIILFIVSLVARIEEDIDNEEMSIFSVEILKNYAIFYCKLEREKEVAGNEVEGTRTGAIPELNDEEIWSGIKLKNHVLYALLRNSTDKNLEDMLCPLFYHDEIADDITFWTGLQKCGEEDLIEELMTIITPTPRIINMLAF